MDSPIEKASEASEGVSKAYPLSNLAKSSGER
jgi:hypothetical protein